MRDKGLIGCFFKRIRLTSFDPMEAEIAKNKLAAVAEELGRAVRVFETSAASLKVSAPMTVNDDESDDSNEFTVEDYYRILSTRKEGTLEMVPYLIKFLPIDWLSLFDVPGLYVQSGMKVPRRTLLLSSCLFICQTYCYSSFLLSF
ncbi:plant UBX domain-containing protein 1-like [Macadamia integrifolia]|uniref:plant UBX domain-containing protein 1-like n=1 Tax=Macadamia integrifolia TaxID=60698 RepID=UPI001C4EABE1|nr:plant UBX domain-containing protein 1-like [Macadamia integrifolia]